MSSNYLKTWQENWQKIIIDFSIYKKISHNMIFNATPYSFYYNFLMNKTRSKSKKNGAAAVQIKPKLTQQQILLDKNGYIIESNDTIFSTTAFRHRPVSEWSMFLSSFFDQITNMRLDSPEIVVNRVETITDFMTEKLFDCSFMRVEWCDSDTVFVWSIFDYPTDWLKSLRLQQQRFNSQSLAQEPKTGD